jgi:hypothetical protein
MGDVWYPADTDDVASLNVLTIAEISDSPGSRIEGSELSVHGTGSPLTELVGIVVTGDSNHSVVANNSLVHDLRQLPAGTGISFTQCGESSPSIVNNLVDSALNGIVTGFGCRALIQGNEVHAVGTADTTSIGIECQDGCIVSDNEVDVVHTALGPQAWG